VPPISDLTHRVRPALRLLGRVILVACGYGFAVWLSIQISLPGIRVSPIRPAQGVMLTALLLTPIGEWWAYLLVLVPISLIGSGGGWFISAQYFLASAVEVAAAATLMRRFSNGRPRLNGLRECLAFVGGALVAGPAIGACIGAFAVVQRSPNVIWFDAWRVWFFGDAVGNVAVVPALLALAAFRTRATHGVRPVRVAEAGAVLLALVAGSLPTLGIFGAPGVSSATAFSMLYVPFPMLVWAGLRFGAMGAAMSTLLLTALSVLSALQGRGPFAQPNSASGVLILQQFIVIAGATAVTLAGVAEERRRTLAALQDSERRYRSLFDTATDVIVTTDLGGLIETANAAFETITGWTRADWLGQPMTTFLDPKAAASAIRRLQEIREGASSQTDAWRVRTRSGDWRVAEVRASVFTQAGLPAGVLIIARDITERQRAEEDRARLENEIAQSRKLEAVGQLAGGIAHDFNNLLQAILGFADITREHLPPGSPGLSSLDKVVQAGERARDLTQQLLTFSRRELIHPKVLDLAAAVGEIGQILRRVLPANVRLLISSDAGTPRVLADRGHIDQIVMNLCVNARDAMPGGGNIAVTIGFRTLDSVFASAHTWAREGTFVTIQVRDTGEGIPAEFLPRIFEPFFTTKEVGQGTGLGLATVYAIVKRYDGLIDVDTAEGLGTTITVYLPPSTGVTAGTDQAPAAQPAAGGRGELILVAEDEPAVRELAVQQLQRAGYKVIAARDGADALRLFADYEPDIRLVFLDVMMPNGDGRDVRKIVGQRRPELPVLFATGYGDRVGHHQDAITDPLIEKPYAAAALLMRIRQILDQSAGGKGSEYRHKQSDIDR
jgi:PAS domain S-box-containing protein